MNKFEITKTGGRRETSLNYGRNSGKTGVLAAMATSHRKRPSAQSELKGDQSCKRHVKLAASSGNSPPKIQ